MIQEISVYLKPQFKDGKSVGIMNDIKEFLGINTIEKLKFVKKYYLEGISEEEASQLSKSLFAEEVCQNYTVNKKMFNDSDKELEVAYQPEMMNPEVASIMTVAKDSGYENLVAADVTWQYFFYGSNISDNDIEAINTRLLMNKTTQHLVNISPKTLLLEGTPAKTKIVALRECNDEQLMALSKGKLFLNLEEMQIIKKYFQDLERDPTDCELEMLAQTWSEHCLHKTFKAKLIINGEEKLPLFKRLQQATIETKRSDIVSAYEDNSGVIDFYDGYAICGKVETHNSPSAIEPYGGAATGSGGVFRDIMGTGLGAKTIISADMFCVAPPETDPETIPKGCLHPRYLLQNVVYGVRDYGNQIGVPTYNGSVHFHPDFRAKPSIIVGAYGIIEKDKAQKGKPKPGDKILALGGRTGRDGIHGATFSSGEMTQETEAINSSAVQIGNAIEEKRTFDACLEINKAGYLHAITDCGAGGFSSAVGEMAEKVGAQVFLEKCPLKYTGLAPWEIWISESQERMVLAIDANHIPEIMKICERFNVEASVIGEFTGDKKLRISHNGEEILNLDIDFIHDGLPQRIMEGKWEEPVYSEPNFPCPENLNDDLVKAVQHLNVCSKEPIVAQYDHTVQSGSVVASYTGKDFKSPSDATVIEPMLGTNRGLATAHGLNPVLNKIDPYYGSLWAILEAVSNMVSAGVNPEYIALIDNFIWPFPDSVGLGQLDRAIDACVDASVAFKMPFISGKDSLSSTYRDKDIVIKIPPVLCISAFAKVDDISKTSTTCFKKTGSKIFLVGNTKSELGGSVYYDNHGEMGNSIPKPDLSESLNIYKAVHKAITSNLTLSCHDLSEGGLATALPEMCFGYYYGAKINLDNIINQVTENRADHLLFSESTNRFIIEVPADKISEFQQFFVDLPCAEIGEVTGNGVLEVKHQNKDVVNLKVRELLSAWDKPMNKVFGKA